GERPVLHAEIRRDNRIATDGDRSVRSDRRRIVPSSRNLTAHLGWNTVGLQTGVGGARAAALRLRRNRQRQRDESEEKTTHDGSPGGRTCPLFAAGVPHDP